MRHTDVSLLHPAYRDKSLQLESRLISAGIPLRRYEGVRAPTRQAELYARGRTIPGTKKVTKAMAWESMHQYGLAEDWVFIVGGKWTWEEPAPGMWQRFHEMAQALDLEPLSFEMPHVQLRGSSISHLKRGVYPVGGDASWEAWLEGQIEGWGTPRREYAGIIHPGAPPPVDIAERPELVA